MTNAIAIFVSVGGWFLWNIILSSTYKPSSTIYYVRSTFLRGFGASLTWWLCLLIILSAILVFELATTSLRAVYFTTDEHIFQTLEQDPLVKRRFEEAAAADLQQGWDRKTNKERDQQERVEETVRKVKQREQERREGEIRDLLRNRVESGADGHRGDDGVGPGADSHGAEIHSILSRGYGDVKTM